MMMMMMNPGNAEMVQRLKLGHDNFAYTLFPIHYLLIIHSFIQFKLSCLKRR
jgi:hypothetical protein